MSDFLESVESTNDRQYSERSMAIFLLTENQSHLHYIHSHRVPTASSDVHQ